MTERITTKAKIEALLQAGKPPREIAEILGVSRRCAPLPPPGAYAIQSGKNA
jgi:hypothetical protein